MKRDPFESAIDEILASADGDVRRALRAVLLKTSRWKQNSGACMRRQSPAGSPTPSTPCIRAG